ncbi:FtsX-like permease family protein [Streptomyces sp. NPDC021020]|uniref:FtsX-like permease family protein n=1 Tax=Streptomyces sp. NPDC021020 TaxID=3365109 RepID=UPI0037AC0C6E
MVLAQLRFRGGRAVALVCALLVAVTSFAVLTGTADTQRVNLTGTVRANARGAYDLLVRPTGARSRLETAGGLVSSTALSGLNGGITTAQWQKIAGLPGVDVAAPVAVVGYSLPMLLLTADVSKGLKPGKQRQLLRVTPVHTSENGLTAVPGEQSYVYVSDLPMHGNDDHPTNPDEVQPDGSVRELCAPVATYQDPDTGRQVPQMADVHCGTSNDDNTFNLASIDDLGSYASGTDPNGTHANPPAGTTLLTWSFPYLVEAVDPASEARLAGLDTAMTSGTYLTGHKPQRVSGSYAQEYGVLDMPSGTDSWEDIPVLMADRPAMDESIRLDLSRLPAAAVDKVAAGDDLAQLEKELPAQKGTPAGSVTLHTGDAYTILLNGLRDVAAGKVRAAPAWRSEVSPLLEDYFSALPVNYTAAGGGSQLAARPVPGLGDLEDLFADPTDLRDTAVRPLSTHQAPNFKSQNNVRMKLVGEFDPEKLRSLTSGLGAVPMETYFAPQATGADPASEQALGGKPLLPNGNIGNLLSVPPSIITTLDALPYLNDPERFDNATPAQGVNRAAPISVIRVRLSGSLGVDALSREKARLAAQRIHDATGLEVDITMGSSPSPVTVADPAGKYGRPALRLDEMWSKKGVAAAVVAAVDRKSLILFVLVLAVCALFVAGATSAAVRARRTELAVLACVGWPARSLFALVLYEVLALGAAAGVAGAALALPLGHLLDVHVGYARAAAAIPAALLLAAVAAVRPAWQAARAHPGAAVAPAVSAPRHGGRVTGITRLGLANLRRVPGRALLGTAALAIGVSALVALAGISAAFHGAVTGTLLGDAVSLQVRGSDYAAAAIAALLGAATIADVLYLNIRERADEYALLHATGWPDGAIGRLVLTEAAAMATLGALLGAGGALTALRVFTGELSGGLALLAAGIAAAAVAVTLVSAALPALSLRRTPPARLLAGE